MRAVYNPNRRRQISNTPIILSQDNSVCNSSCNSPCDQVYLTHSIFPREITSADQNVTLTFAATNATSQPINQPLVIVSSLLGTFLLSNTGLAPGETKSVSRSYSLSNLPFPTHSVTNTSYVAYANTIPGGYAPGERVSAIGSTTADMEGNPTTPIISASGSIFYTEDEETIINMNFSVDNTGSPIINLSVPVGSLLNWSEGITIVRNTSNVFQLDTARNLILANGQTLQPGNSYRVTVFGGSANSQYCTDTSCTLTYSASTSTTTNSNLQTVLKKNTSSTM